MVADSNRLRHNCFCFTDVALPQNIIFTTTIEPADLVLVALPAEVIGNNIAQLASMKEVPIVICSKGLLGEEGLFLSDIISSQVSNPVAVLSGPNFAKEVVRGLPAATMIACTDPELGSKLVAGLGSVRMRPYYSADLRGVQVAGAVKNVLAVASGIVMGRKLGENAVAALLTRGLIEMQRLLVALGGQADTALSLAGVGDLLLTAGSPTSRNTALGMALAEGKALTELLKEPITREGYPTAKAVYHLALKHQVDMPICAAVYQVLYMHADIDGAIEGLLQRPFKMV